MGSLRSIAIMWPSTMSCLIWASCSPACSAAASYSALNTGNVILTKLEFSIRITRSCITSALSSFDLIDAASDAGSAISEEPISSAKTCCVWPGLGSVLIAFSRSDANRLANSGNSRSASSLYLVNSLKPFDLKSPCRRICFPGFVLTRASRLTTDGSFPLTQPQMPACYLCVRCSLT